MKKCYIYKLDKDYTIHIDGLPDFDSPYVHVKNETLLIRKGYRFNGCSPRISVFDLFSVGTPNGIVDWKTGLPKTYFASLTHDAIYQYGIGSRKNADKVFLKLLKKSKFKSARLYYIAVRLFGWVGKTKWSN